MSHVSEVGRLMSSPNAMNCTIEATRLSIAREHGRRLRASDLVQVVWLIMVTRFATVVIALRSRMPARSGRSPPKKSAGARREPVVGIAPLSSRRALRRDGGARGGSRRRRSRRPKAAAAAAAPAGRGRADGGDGRLRVRRAGSFEPPVAQATPRRSSMASAYSSRPAACATT